MAVAIFAGVAGAGCAGGAATDREGSCPHGATGAQAAERTLAALSSPLDVWGELLRSQPGGPDVRSARALLPPLFFARAAHQRPLTVSGAYYLPFAEPVGNLGAGAVALHLADGSQILAGRVGGPSLSIGVGTGGREPFGSCLARLGTPSLADGYLPILETQYRDDAGASYRQESFAASPPGLHGLVSFVRIEVDARAAREPVVLNLTLSASPLRAAPGRVLTGAETVLLDAPGGSLRGSTLSYRVRAGKTETIYAAFLDRPRVLAKPQEPLPALYAAARRAVAAYWQARLAAGGSIEVPDPEVDDAERALLIQNLELGYRYSVGNAYQEFSFPETIDVARVMGEWGFPAVERAILTLSLSRPPTPYPNWTRGEKLVAAAEDYDLFRDRAFVVALTPALSAAVATMARELSSRDGLLPREHYSSDIPLEVYGLPAQTVAWQGLTGIAAVWSDTGDSRLAARARNLADRLHAGIARAVASSERWLSDGSLFVPAMLLSGEKPYASLTRSRLGSYWNLVMPYALASGFFVPGGTQARGILEYLYRHGALLAGLVRAGAYALYGRSAPPPVSGTDEVYGTNLARFLAANDQAGELGLSLYAQLADAMTPGTFVSGEAASIAPLPLGRDRAMYLPPNSAANAAFLETLRLMLVSETTRGSAATGLDLGFSTPRAWLLPGRTIRVRDLPTSFGPLSFSIRTAGSSVRVTIAPSLRPPASLLLRLRLPDRRRITAVSSNGRPFRRFDARSGTVDLSGIKGRIELTVSVS